MNCVEGDYVAVEGSEGDSMDEVVACVHADEVDTYKAAGYHPDPPVRGVDLGLVEEVDTGILPHWVSEGNPDASKGGAGTQEAGDDGTKWLDCRAHWATATDATAADLEVCPWIASFELVAMPLELISKERESS